MTGSFDLLLSYAMIGSGFVVFGTLVHAWLAPDRFGGGPTGLVAASVVLGLLGAVLVVVGLHWHRTATDAVASPGPRKL